MLKVAVVILNWNGKHWLEKFLPEVIARTPEGEVIVADNASTDDSIEYLNTHFPNIRIVQNAMNGGFAKGYNDALQHIEAEYYVLLNSDVEVSEGWLPPLIKCMEEESVAVCQPKIRSYEQPEFFEYAGAAGGFMDKNYYPFCRGRIFDTLEQDQGQYNQSMEVFWASGACMMVRAADFHRAGGFDEDFFAHMEEIDLCWRFKRMGMKIMVVHESLVFHVGGGTLDYSSPRKVYLNFRNNLLMLVKNHEGWLTGKLFVRMSLDGVAAMRYLVGGKFNLFSAVLKAHFSHYGQFRKSLKKRKNLKNAKTAFNKNGWYRGNILWAYFFKGNKRFSDLNQRLFSDQHS